MHDRRPLADAADHEPAVDTRQQRFKIWVHARIGAHHGVLDRDGHAVVDQARHGIKAARVIAPPVVEVLQVEHQRDTGALRDFASARLEPLGVARVGTRQQHRAGKGKRAEHTHLIDRAPERRANARNHPQRIWRTRHPPERLGVVVERHVVEKCVAAIQQPCDAAADDVVAHRVVGGQVDGPPQSGLSAQRRHGIHAGEI